MTSRCRDGARNYELLNDRQERLEEILEEIDDGQSLASQQVAITFVEVAQGRVRTSAGRIHDDLMRAFDFHLFNRMEASAHAVTVLELYKSFHARATEERSVFPDFYRDIAERRDTGRLGAMDKALDPILQMVSGADRIANEHAPAAMRALAVARAAESNKDAAAALATSRQNQRLMIKEFKSLLAKLEAWNEFQDVITNTRSLLDQQRDIRSRTKKLQGDKRK